MPWPENIVPVESEPVASFVAGAGVAVDGAGAAAGVVDVVTSGTGVVVVVGSVVSTTMGRANAALTVRVVVT